MLFLIVHSTRGFHKEGAKGTLYASSSYGVVRTTIRMLSYSTTAAQENQRPCSEKTKVYNGVIVRASQNMGAKNSSSITIDDLCCLWLPIKPVQFKAIPSSPPSSFMH
ncbi:hypothetical protein TNCV_324481 [Trichonephila clavipes]|nr:hypothetical protein TNCV_324481 [Trichonephila clavipes]